jgi:multisubunit Na+/H+ antiporter MnhE subunit
VRWRSVLEAAIWWFLLLLLWLIFVSGVPLAEVAAGAVAAALAAALGMLAWRAAEARFAPRARWLFELRHLPLRLLLDTLAVFAVLVRTLLGHRPPGRYLALPAPVRANDRRTGARRVLLTLLVSFTPDTIVVAFDQEEGFVLVHRLAPGADDLPLRLP